jgi:hypothetical protein
MSWLHSADEWTPLSRCMTVCSHHACTMLMGPCIAWVLLCQVTALNDTACTTLPKCSFLCAHIQHHDTKASLLN